MKTKLTLSICLFSLFLSFMFVGKTYAYDTPVLCRTTGGCESFPYGTVNWIPKDGETVNGEPADKDTLPFSAQVSLFKREKNPDTGLMVWSPVTNWTNWSVTFFHQNDIVVLNTIVGTQVNTSSRLYDLARGKTLTSPYFPWKIPIPDGTYAMQVLFYKDKDGKWLDMDYNSSIVEKILAYTPFGDTSEAETYAGKTIFTIKDGVAQKPVDINVKYRGKVSQNELVNALNTAMNYLMETIGNAINKFSGWIESALENTNINDTYEAWYAVRTISITLLMLGLIIVAFANVLNIDIAQYGAQRMIPRFVMNIVLTFFSFLIVKILLEVANILQVEFRSIMTAPGMGGTTIPLGSFSLASGDIWGDIAATLLLAALLIGLLIAMIYLFLMLMARIVIIKFLVVMGPVALVLGIMPFTESQLKQWWSELFKWIFMGPAIMGLLLVGSVILSKMNQAHQVNISTINTSFLDDFQNVFYVLTAAIVYFMAAAIPLQMGSKIMAAWDKKVRGGAKHLPGVKTGQQFLAQRKKDSERKAAERAAKIRAGLGKVPIAGRLAGYRSKLERDTAWNRSENAEIAEKVKLLDSMSREKRQEKLIALNRTNYLGRNNKDIHALMNSLAAEGGLEGNASKNKELFDVQQKYLTQFAPTDGTLFTSTVKENLAAALQNNVTMGAAIASVKGKNITDIKENDLLALATEKTGKAGGYEILQSITAEDIREAFGGRGNEVIRNALMNENVQPHLNTEARAELQNHGEQTLRPQGPAGPVGTPPPPSEGQGD